MVSFFLYLYNVSIIWERVPFLITVVLNEKFSSNVLASTVASLIAVVKSSLALSLGLVGALSVVRFRTAVKEPYNLAFILLAVCLGISIGASQFSFAILITIFGILAILYAYKESAEDEKIANRNIILDTISITINSKYDLSNVYKILDKNCLTYTIKSINSVKDDNTEIVLNLSIKSHDSLNKIIESLKQDVNAKDILFYSSPSI